MFEWLLLAVMLIGGMGIGYETAPKGVSAPLIPRTTTTGVEVAPQTQDLGPIFRCSGAGTEVLVSLGQDGSSLFFSCTKVKS